MSSREVRGIIEDHSKTPPSQVEVFHCEQEKITSKTHAELCNLRGSIRTERALYEKTRLVHAKISSLAAPPELSISEASKKVIDPKSVQAWISSPEGVQYRIRFPNNLEKNVPQVFAIGSKKLTLKRLDQNGYNSEYEIVDETGSRWIVLGTLFTLTNPPFKPLEEIENRIKEIKKEKEKREKEWRDLAAGLKSSPKIQDKKGRIVPDKRKIDLMQRRQSVLSAELEHFRHEQGMIETKEREYRDALTGKRRYSSFSYTPYQSYFDTPLVQGEGLSHVRDLVLKTYQDIRKIDQITINEQGIRTKRISSTELLARSPTELAFLLNIIERMDYKVYTDRIERGRTQMEPIPGDKKKRMRQVPLPPRTILKDAKTVESLMQAQSARALTTFGLNREDAYKWQRNNESQALGVAQLTPKSYELFQRKYSFLKPEAGVPDDHEIGAKDQRIALRFQVAHLYDEYTQLPPWIRENWEAIMRDPKAKVGIYAILAAGYNGSMKNTLEEAGVLGKGKHSISELYPERLREKFAHNEERYTYVIKLEYLYKKFFEKK